MARARGVERVHEWQFRGLLDVLHGLHAGAVAGEDAGGGVLHAESAGERAVGAVYVVRDAGGERGRVDGDAVPAQPVF